jgi:hypothetical protein
MLGFRSFSRALVAAAWFVTAYSTSVLAENTTRVVFDLPDTIECRDVTPHEFAVAHPALKVIEGKFRVSARIVSGAEGEVVDFLYFVASPNRKMRFQDYLPNTTLESTTADNVIEVTDTTENSNATDADAKVGYKATSFGVTKNKGTKKTESAHSKQVAAKALVVASGTTDREHGLFFKLRPSKADSLEGAKQFTFLATVPRTWRGDWCTISCAARAKSKNFLSKTVIAPAGIEQTQVGMYLAADEEAATLAEELRDELEAHAAVLASHMRKDGEGLLNTMYEAISSQSISGKTTLCGIFNCKGEGSRRSESERTKLEEAEQAVLYAQDRLSRLAR